MKTQPEDHREVEWKYLLESEDEYRRLIGYLGSGAPLIRQENHYWICPEQPGQVLRLRLEEGHWSLTVKGPSERQGARFSRREISLALDPSQAARCLAGDWEGLGGTLAALGLGLPLKEAGALVTERRRWLTCGFEVALDRSHFPRGPLLELELEQLEAQADPAFPPALLARCRIPARPAAQGKFSRLQQQLQDPGAV
jgi:uncharacterized protein YjbK